MNPVFEGIGATPVTEVTPLTDINVELTHLVEDDAGIKLAGSRCHRCGTGCFPRREVCLNCGSRDVADEALVGEGSLYSFSTVHVSSSRPVPYTIGYVDLVSGVRLLASIEAETAALRCDIPVRLHRTEKGFAFCAVEEEAVQ